MKIYSRYMGYMDNGFRYISKCSYNIYIGNNRIGDDFTKYQVQSDMLYKRQYNIMTSNMPRIVHCSIEDTKIKRAVNDSKTILKASRRIVCQLNNGDYITHAGRITGIVTMEVPLGPCVKLHKMR